MKRKNKVFIIIIVIIVTGLIILFFLNNTKNNLENSLEPTPISYPTYQTTYNNIKPGESEEIDLKDKLGNPIKSYNYNNFTVSEYKGSNPNFNDQYFTKDEKVVLIKEFTKYGDDNDAYKIMESYGDASWELYGPYSEIGFLLYVYPQDGIAYLGNKDKNVVIEIWYFKAVNTLEEFINLFAPNYQAEKFNTSQMIDKGPDN